MTNDLTQARLDKWVETFRFNLCFNSFIFATTFTTIPNKLSFGIVYFLYILRPCQYKLTKSIFHLNLLPYLHAVEQHRSISFVLQYFLNTVFVHLVFFFAFPFFPFFSSLKSNFFAYFLFIINK